MGAGMIQHPARSVTSRGLGSSRAGERGATLHAPRARCPGCDEVLIEGACGWCREEPVVGLAELRRLWWPL